MSEQNNCMSLSDMPEILDADLIANYLNICYNKSLNLIKYGGIKHMKIGNQYRVPKQYFIEWLETATIAK